MPKLLKWVLGGVAGIVVLIVLAIIIVPIMVDPNDYREQITDAVKKQTGRDLTLDGDLSVSVFPWAGVRTEGLRLSQPAQIEGDMLSVDTAQIRVKLLPLLGSKVEVGTIILEQPSVRLITLADGTDSFAGLISDEAAEEVEVEVEAEADDGSALGIIVQGLKITGGTVVYDDQKAGSRYDVTEFNLLTGNLLGGDLASVEMSGNVADSSSPDTIEFELDAMASIDQDTLQIILKNLKANATQAAQSFKFGFDELKIQQNQTLNLLGLAAAASIENRTFDISAPTVALNMDNQTANMASLTIVSDDMNVSLNDVAVVDLSGNLSATGTLEVPAFNAAKLLSDMAIDYPTADKKALTAVALNAAFKAGTSSVNISKMALKLDDSTLSGDLAIRDFDTMALEFALSLDTLNADRYLGPEDPAAVAEEETAAEDGTAAELIAIPMDAFQGVNVNGEFSAKQFIISGLTLNNIDVKIESTDSTLTITPKAGLYDGNLLGKIAYAESAKNTTVKVNQKIDLINLSPLLADADVSDRLSGVATLNVDLDVNEQDGKQSNSGTIKLLAKNGAIKGVDIKAILDSVSSKLGSGNKEDTKGAGKKNDETKFAELIGTFHLKNNRLTNNDFSMSAPLFRINGKGVIDLAAETIDYRVDVSLVATSEGQGGSQLKDLAGLTIPIRFSNNLYEPSYSLDMAALFGNIAKQKLKDKKSAFLKSKTGGDIDISTNKEQGKKLLKGLFGKKKKKGG